MKKYVIDRGCKNCGECIYECPAHAINLVDNERAEINQDKCRHCGKCYDACSSEAISIYDFPDK